MNKRFINKASLVFQNLLKNIIKAFRQSTQKSVHFAFSYTSANTDPSAFLDRSATDTILWFGVMSFVSADTHAHAHSGTTS